MANVSDDDYTSYKEYKAGILIWKIVPPILILFGTVGNGLSIIVLTRRSIRSSTTALYLTVLAFSDLFVLYSGLLRQWLRFLFETDVRHVSEFGCKLNIWLVYCSLDYSAWILLLVTLERVISAWLPHNARTLCTKNSAAAVLISVGVFILCLNAHLLYGMVFKYSEDENGNQELEKCVEINDEYYVFFNVTWPWVDLCAFCVIPFTVIVIGNALILFKVVKSQKKVKSRVVPSVAGGSQQQTTSGHGHKQSSMTAMLFTLNIVFLLSTSPISIYNVGYTYWVKDASSHEYAQLDLWWAVVNMLMYTNNSLNFLLYCLSGTKFRREVIRTFTSWNRRTNTNMQLAHSNYTRTKFDTPSPMPTPRHSVFTLNTQTQNLSPTGGINGQQNAGDNGENNFGHSNNSLHPNDALRTVNNTSSFKSSSAKQVDSSLSDSIEVSETIVLDKLDGCGLVKSKANTDDGCDVDTSKTENREKYFDNPKGRRETETQNQAENSKPGANGDNNVHTHCDDVNDVSKLSPVSKNHNVDVNDSTV